MTKKRKRHTPDAADTGDTRNAKRALTDTDVNEPGIIALTEELAEELRHTSLGKDLVFAATGLRPCGDYKVIVEMTEELYLERAEDADKMAAVEEGLDLTREVLRVKMRGLLDRVRRLRAKIDPDPANPHYIISVRGMGYKIGP